ncbi:MAG TPA: antibiotic biosynthesis monooxygenase family protein [Thermoanaerobaculia bacterium]|nr:antibiotic biosynthesis monooxygenase family protein [Thermoanaerobaculia bacterium]
MSGETTRRDALRAGAAVAIAGVGFSRLAAAEPVDLSKAITQTAAFRIDGEREAEAVAALTELARAVEEKEPGVLAYIPHRVASDPTQVVFFEVYADEEAMRAHGQQPHLAKLREHFGAGLFKPFAEGKVVEIVRLDRIAGFSR